MSRSSLFAGFFASPPPPAAVEISSRRVTVVGLAVHGASRTVTGYSSEPLAAGVVTPALNAVNIHDQTALALVVKTAIDRLSPRPRRVALVLPDSVGKVSLLRFEKVPAKLEELDQLIRWQVRKAAPFRIEDAQVSWTEGAQLAGGGHEYVVVVARRDLVEAYERVCEAAGVHAGLVDLASLSLVNAVLATQAADIATASGDWLLVNADPDYTTLAVVRGGRMIFFRSRPADSLDAGDMGDLVHQTAMYHEDRLGGGGFSRVFLSGGGDAAERARRQIEERLGIRVEPPDVRGSVALRDRIAAGEDLLDALAPAAGILLRDVPARVARKGERVA